MILAMARKKGKDTKMVCCNVASFQHFLAALSSSGPMKHFGHGDFPTQKIELRQLMDGLERL